MKTLKVSCFDWFTHNNRRRYLCDYHFMRYVNSHISTCLDRSQAGKVVKTGFRSKIGTIHARIQVLDSCWETKICNEMIARILRRSYYNGAGSYIITCNYFVTDVYSLNSHLQREYRNQVSGVWRKNAVFLWMHLSASSHNLTICLIGAVVLLSPYSISAEIVKSFFFEINLNSLGAEET